MLRALCLGRHLIEGSTGTLVEAALFLAIVGLAWPTRGGHQCWKMVLSSRWDQKEIAEAFVWTGASGEGVLGGKWVQTKLGFHKCIQLPPPLYRVCVPLL